MKRLVCLLTAVGVVGMANGALAGDYHVGTTLVCSDCHVMHYSQTHGYGEGGLTPFTPLGSSGPYNHLLRNEVNTLCLSCHDGSTSAPDVFGKNDGAEMVRMAGALNSADEAKRANDNGYQHTDGHSLWSKLTAPGGTWAPDQTKGLRCNDCHAPHGIATQYRNVLNRGIFGNISSGGVVVDSARVLTYATTNNDLTKDVFQTVPKGYKRENIHFNEPNNTRSAYGRWCQACHTDFHGSGGAANMGGASAGKAGGSTGWLRHPTADVDIGNTPTMTFVSSIARFNSLTNKPKVLDSRGLWDGSNDPATGYSSVTPSCMSCHAGHGNKNAFGLVFTKGTGEVTEEGDGGTFRELCRGCHAQGTPPS